uniref:Chemokine interleukin-8-like domain-containing protein n=1 Tax=Anguilla anguilla TaxID=7936 RepID=A0A0E9WT91_ANGAN
MEKRSRTSAMLRAAAAVLLAASVLCSYAAASTEEVLDCCLSTKNKPIPSSIVKGYSIQTTASGCLIPATLFITKKDLSLCAPPASRSKWVKKLIKRLDRKAKPKRKRGKKN